MQVEIAMVSCVGRVGVVDLGRSRSARLRLAVRARTSVWPKQRCRGVFVSVLIVVSAIYI